MNGSTDRLRTQTKCTMVEIEITLTAGKENEISPLVKVFFYYGILKDISFFTSIHSITRQTAFYNMQKPLIQYASIVFIHESV